MTQEMKDLLYTAAMWAMGVILGFGIGYAIYNVPPQTISYVCTSEDGKPVTVPDNSCLKVVQ